MLRALLLGLAAVLSCAAAETPPSGRELIPGADKMTAEQRDAYRASKLVGDPARGAKLHQGCFGCHGIERYTQPVTHASAAFMDSVLRASGLSDLPPAEPKRFKGRITSVDALRAAVVRRNDYFNPQLTAQEIEDVVAYLNKTYYNFADK
ncbi:MAG TPA: c-type cytochrome [Burkholderiales bacterium]|nr:c-type cytochrome [Burkholderiales bacterium]